jgi:hypothetical protein
MKLASTISMRISRACDCPGVAVESQTERRGLSDTMLPVLRELLKYSTKAEKSVVIDFAAAQLPGAPKLGYEVSGARVSFAWPKHKIAVVESQETQSVLEQDGLTILEPDVE